MFALPAIWECVVNLVDVHFIVKMIIIFMGNIFDLRMSCK